MFIGLDSAQRSLIQKTRLVVATNRVERCSTMVRHRVTISDKLLGIDITMHRAAFKG